MMAESVNLSSKSPMKAHGTQAYAATPSKGSLKESEHQTILKQGITAVPSKRNLIDRNANHTFKLN